MRTSTAEQLPLVPQISGHKHMDELREKSKIMDHFEGRQWRGFHHHAALCSAAHAFLALRRALFPPAKTAMDAR
ncbi:MAG: hypothetical protein GY811_10300 [Myxococcales bacterium]|nr:hypothetical protein [Myxococcales bacterium]